MKIVIDIDDNLYARLFDNGVDNYDDAVDMAKAIRKGTPFPKGHGKLTNHEWIDFLAEQFDISRTSAKEMLHAMMSVKKEDNFKKQFSQGKKGFSQGYSQGRK